MELRDYQHKAMETCTPSSDNLAYMLMNLQGEVGWDAEVVAAQNLAKLRSRADRGVGDGDNR